MQGPSKWARNGAEMGQPMRGTVRERKDRTFIHPNRVEYNEYVFRHYARTRMAMSGSATMLRLDMAAQVMKKIGFSLLQNVASKSII